MDARELDRLHQMFGPPVDGDVPPGGLRRAIGLRHRSGRGNLFIALFDNEEAVLAANFGPTPPREADSWPAPATYTVVLDDPGQPGELIDAVTVTMLDAPAREVASAVDHIRDQLLARLRQHTSCLGVVVLADHGRNDAICLTFWAIAAVGLVDHADAHEVAFIWRPPEGQVSDTTPGPR